MKGNFFSVPGNHLRLLFVIGALVALGMTAAAVFAANGDDGEVLHACAGANGSLRLVGDANECRRNESAVSWNVEGPAGPQGPAGREGDSELMLLHLTDQPPVSETRAAYINFDGIDGESTDDGHKDWINLLSVSQGIHRPAAEGGSVRSSSGPKLDDIVIVKEVDASTPKLMEAIADGTVFPNVVFDLTELHDGGRRTTYLKYELKNVYITSYSLGGSAQSDVVPTEQVSLNFEEIKVTYTKTDDDGASKGNVEFEWKVEEGQS
ncbi:MAG: type VI secretion system tube protein Hcp [Dehalococcoidia bacterium]